MITVGNAITEKTEKRLIIIARAGRRGAA